ncbi:MAG TPA: pseudouridine-5'-phosphate glycosidase [Acetobacteraceae bacterium]|nr:pseudouridine-5'-phosphate glycosidase [Acetobacteraceae bacterium]
MPHDLLSIRDEVREALEAGRPVVALESTIITHGMPFPENLAMARDVERIVRDAGAVPATIALLDGQPVVGVAGAALERLAETGAKAAKASARDLAALMVSGATAGTTVAATMRLAARAGIAVFATGGIGGVHRGAEQSFDISADLLELARTRVAVVCAGAKSILDIGRTLEVLETQGVPVIGYRTDDFPAFFARTSGHAVDHRLDSPAEVARAVALHRALGGGGMLVANPIPPEAALDEAAIAARIDAAIADATAAGIGGKALTPFLLARIVELTEGRSLAANIALVRHNAEVAAAIAVALAELPRA